MKGKVFIPSEERFYIIDGIEKCDKCGKSTLVYDGCKCHTEEAKWLLLRDYLDVQYDVKVAMLGRMKNTDIYLEGLIRGEITCLIKIKEIIKELEK